MISPASAFLELRSGISTFLFDAACEPGTATLTANHPRTIGV